MALTSLRIHCFTFWNLLFLSLIDTQAKKCDLTRPPVQPVAYIINGHRAKSFGLPFVAGIGTSGIDFKYYIKCTASIIAPMWVLTAAHCVIYGQDMFVVAGTVKTRVQHSNIFTIQKIVLHEEFNQTGYHDNDLAIVQLLSPLPLSRAIDVICLSLDEIVYTVAHVAGFGLVLEDGPQSSTLKHMIVECQDELCYLAYPLIFNTQKQTCAGANRKATSNGDSGGPLYGIGKNGFVLIGLVSWAIGCGGPGKPTIYTKVGHYKTWLNIHTSNSICFTDCFAN